MELIPYITAGVTAIVTYWLGKLSKKFKWNEKLPIEVQNVLITITAFAVSILIVYLCGEPLEFKTIAIQIISSLSGSGGATIYYDNKKAIKGE